MMKWLLQNFVVVCGVLALASGGAQAADWYVDALAAPGGNGGGWATAYAEIQEAVDAAADGDTVWVTNGTYAPITTSNKAIAITSMNGAEHTIIDGGGSNGCAVLGEWSDQTRTVLTGFTLQNGNAPDWDSGGGATAGTLNHCILANNEAYFNGGGAYLSTLNNCILRDNSAVWYGGGSSDSILNNCILYNNTSSYGGGSRGGTLNNCTLYGNTASSGGGVYDSALNNCIVWGNTGSSGNNISTYRNVKSTFYDEASDPLFASAATGDFRLTANSPCVNAGNPALVVLATDMNGTPMAWGGYAAQGALATLAGDWLFAAAVGIGRAQTNGVQMLVSADETRSWSAVVDGAPWITLTQSSGIGGGGVVFNVTANDTGAGRTGRIIITGGGLTATGTVTQGTVWYVAPNGNNTTGMDWVTAFHQIQAAVDAAGSHDVIRVADGTYAPISTADKKILIQSENGAGAAIIDGGGTNRCATLGEGINTRLSGFTLQNGTMQDEEGQYQGGGSYGGTLEHCVLTGNKAYEGGGAYGGVLNHCVIRGNFAAWNGGCVYGGTLNHCVVFDNEASGSDIAHQSTLNNCTVYGNTAGAFVAYESTLNNCIVWGNSLREMEENGFLECILNHTFTNAASDPLFVGAVSGDFRLRAGSPCVGAGDTNRVVLAVDMDGTPMIQDGAVNQGAFAGVVSAWLSVAPGLPVGGEAATGVQLAVTASGSWSAAADVPWITLQQASGSGDGIILFDVAESGARRTGNIVVSGGGLAATCTVTQAGTWYVAPNGGNTAGTNWATAFTSIQAAVDTAGEYDLILVTNGVYAPIDTGNKRIRIESVNGAAHTVLDGGGTNRCATLASYDGQVNTVLTGFTLRNGYSSGEGGGSFGGTLNRCIISGNATADRSHGGGSAYGVLNDCTISGNTAFRSSGVYRSTLNNCMVVSNYATGSDESSGLSGGGATYSTLNNCIIAGNSALDGASAVYNSTLNNCTVTGNTNRYYAVLDSTLNNCIAWGNTYTIGVSAEVYNCELFQTFTNAAGDPRFVASGNGDFRLRADSPCVDAGDTNLVVLFTDMTGAPMVTAGGTVNQGALAGVSTDWVVAESIHIGPAQADGISIRVEATGAWQAASDAPWLTFTQDSGSGDGTLIANIQANTTAPYRTAVITLTSGGLTFQSTVLQYTARYVSKTGNDTDGLGWDTAFRTIQQAVNDTDAFALIHVANGVYPPFTVANKRIEIRSVNGADHTFIDGGGTTRCATLGNWMQTDTVLTGFTLRNGFSTGDGGGAQAGTLNHCILRNNRAQGGGGAYGSVLNNCLVISNTANYNSSGDGGGIRSATLNNCTVYGNTARRDGGGSAYGTLNNCIIWGNTAGSNPNVVYTTVNNNSFTDPASDPLFANPAAGEFALKPGSPCLNAGDISLVVLSTDMTGAAMIQNGQVNQGAIAGEYAETTNSPVPVPHRWLDQYQLVTGGDYEAAALTAWEDYVAGTDPTNPADQFTVALEIQSGTPILTWFPDLTPWRTYTLQGKTNLTDTLEQWLPTNTLPDSPTRFFRATVTLP